MINHSNDVWPNPRYGWYVVLLLTLAYILAYMDRIVLGLLLELIRTDFQISDTQVSLLGGMAFALFYVVMGLPLGRMADRANRRNIISASIFVWSLMTTFCGLATNFWQLFLARVGVGVGEAGLTPAAHSMLSDYFPPHRRPLVIAVYMAGTTIGAGIAYIVGGTVIDIVSRMPELTLPVVGRLSSWQLTFMIVGIPGILVALWTLTIREPVRRGTLQVASGKGEASLREVATFMFRENRTTFLSIYMAFGGFALHGVALVLWLPAYFKRSFGWTEMQVGTTYGLTILVFGTLGMVGITRVVDWLRDRGHRDAMMRAPLYMALLMTPFSIAATLIPDPRLSFIAIVPHTMLSFGLAALGPGTLQLITPNQMRGQALAIYAFCNNVIGLIIGGTFVALITDFVFKDPQMLGYSLATTGLLFLPVSLVLLAIGLAPFRKSLDAADTWMHKG